MLKIFLLTIILSCTLSAQYFTKITTGPHVNDGGDSRSVNWVDYDNDGDLDLFITNGPSSRANNFLYKNNGDGTFQKITDVSVVNDLGSYDGSSWADYDNDGFIDVFSVTWYGQTNSLHRQRNGMFEKITFGSVATDKTYSETASWADYDNDGYVDLYVTNSAGKLGNFLYHNNGDGTFSKITTGAIVIDAKPSRGVSWCDFDNDGYVDLFIAHEANNNNSLYWNNGDGTFTAETSGAIVNDGGDSFGCSVGDINNDGYYDVFVANYSNQNNFLYLNNGKRTFTKVTADTVVNDHGYSIGSTFGDFDNDGYLDLFVANGFSGSSKTKNFLYHNNGNGTFTKVDTGVVSTDLGWSYGTACGDYDRDGDLDIFTANCFGGNQNNSLYRNEGNDNSWLTIQLIGRISNFSAIGALVKAKAIVNGNSIWQVRDVSGQSGYCGQNLEVHFGLGNATQIDSLIIEWPSRQRTIQTNVGVKQHLKITESAPNGIFAGAVQIDKFRLHQNYPNPFNPSTAIQFDLPYQSFVSLKVYDGIGRQVTTIVSEEMSAGSYTKKWNTNGMPSGVYFYRLQAGAYIETKKTLLLK
ncbi:MAG: FG-GAP-like repeat-containing protein [Ignavibacteriales bacterium]|nr:FG-GAP-like repeat-containing protein [Ignavibacteriales bacterium]